MISPVIVELGPLSLRWYGVLTALGGLAGYLLIDRRCGRYGIKREALGNLMLVTILSAIIGARLFYVIRFWNESFALNPFPAVFKVWEGGLVFQGGFIVCALALIAYALINRIPIGKLADLMAPAIPLGHAIGRIGCLINGCCFGFFPYDGPCGVTYAATGSRHFPAQAVESFGNLLICLLLLFLEKRRLVTDKIFLVYLMAYTILRFAVEPLRGDYPLSQNWCGMTPGQYHALWQLPLIIAVFAAVSLYRKHHPKA